MTSETGDRSRDRNNNAIRIIVVLILLAVIIGGIMLFKSISNEIEDRGNSDCINACVAKMCAEADIRCGSAEKMIFRDTICKSECRKRDIS